MSAAVLTRRAALTGAVASVAAVSIAAAAVAVPFTSTAAAGAQFADLMKANREAVCRFNTLPMDLERRDPVSYQAELQLMLDASARVDRAAPTNWQEFTQLLEHMTDDGESVLSEDNTDRLLAAARRLAKQEGRA